MRHKKKFSTGSRLKYAVSVALSYNLVYGIYYFLTADTSLNMPKHYKDLINLYINANGTEFIYVKNNILLNFNDRWKSIILAFYIYSFSLVILRNITSLVDKGIKNDLILDSLKYYIADEAYNNLKFKDILNNINIKKRLDKNKISNLILDSTIKYNIVIVHKKVKIYYDEFFENIIDLNIKITEDGFVNNLTFPTIDEILYFFYGKKAKSTYKINQKYNKSNYYRTYIFTIYNLDYLGFTKLFNLKKLKSLLHVLLSEYLEFSLLFIDNKISLYNYIKYNLYESVYLNNKIPTSSISKQNILLLNNQFNENITEIKLENLDATSFIYNIDISSAYSIYLKRLLFSLRFKEKLYFQDIARFYSNYNYKILDIFYKKFFKTLNPEKYKSASFYRSLFNSISLFNNNAIYSYTYSPYYKINIQSVYNTHQEQIDYIKKLFNNKNYFKINFLFDKILNKRIMEIPFFKVKNNFYSFNLRNVAIDKLLNHVKSKNYLYENPDKLRLSYMNKYRLQNKINFMQSLTHKKIEILKKVFLFTNNSIPTPNKKISKDEDFYLKHIIYSLYDAAIDIFIIYENLNMSLLVDSSTINKINKSNKKNYNYKIKILYTLGFLLSYFTKNKFFDCANIAIFTENVYFNNIKIKHNNIIKKKYTNNYSNLELDKNFHYSKIISHNHIYTKSGFIKYFYKPMQHLLLNVVNYYINNKVPSISDKIIEKLFIPYTQDLKWYYYFFNFKYQIFNYYYFNNKKIYHKYKFIRKLKNLRDSKVFIDSIVEYSFENFLTIFINGELKNKHNYKIPILEKKEMWFKKLIKPQVHTPQYLYIHKYGFISISNLYLFTTMNKIQIPKPKNMKKEEYYKELIILNNIAKDNTIKNNFIDIRDVLTSSYLLSIYHENLLVKLISLGINI